MIKSIYADADNSIYEKSGSLNAGLDSNLEITKVVSSDFQVHTSRVLINFPLADISASIAKEEIVNPRFYLNLFQTETNEVPLEYTLIAYAVSQSWVNGVGKVIEPTNQGGFIREGSSWIYRNKQESSIEYLPARDTQWTSRSFHEGIPVIRPAHFLSDASNILYSSVTGGGTWFKDYYGTQSFEHESSDIRMDVTPVVNYLIGTGSNYHGNTTTMGRNGKNDGFILLRSGSQETDTTNYGSIKFFSRETNTVYQPKLEVVYDDSSFVTGSLTELSSEQSTVYLKNLKHEYARKESPKLRVIGRDRYPVKTFSTQSNYRNINFLPTSSYYAVKDAITEEFIIPYNSTGTKVSCDSNGNFINIEMNSFMPERYYKLCFQVTQSDASVVVYDENFYFKVNR